MFKIKKNLLRKEKRLLNKINSPKIYKYILGIIFMLFGLKKRFLIFGKKGRKKIGVISITSNYFLGRKISYIDDFIVNKKSRGKGIGKSLFTNILKETKGEKKSDYIFLVTKKDREKSHGIYKKFGFSLISLGIGYLAYKKVKKK